MGNPVYGFPVRSTSRVDARVDSRPGQELQERFLRWRFFNRCTDGLVAKAYGWMPKLAEVSLADSRLRPMFSQMIALPQRC